MPEKYTWILWTFREQTATINDEFIADGFRVVLMGDGPTKSSLSSSA